MAKKPVKKPVQKTPPPTPPLRQAATKRHSLPAWQTMLIQHGAIILAFYVLVMIFFKPIVFDGKILQQDDSINYLGLSQNIVEYRNATGEEALWNANIFSGMPAYQAGVLFDGNWFFFLETSLMRFFLPRPANYIFLTFVGFFFLLLTLNLGPWISGLGAVAYALSSYWFIIHIPGHVSKAAAIAYMAFLVASVLMTYRGKYVLGGALTAFFVAMEVTANHYQISYYLLMAFLVLGAVYFVDAIRQKTLPRFLTASAVVLFAALIGVGPNLGRVWTTAEYANVTMRGGNELPAAGGESKGGLEKDYAFMWSYGIPETFTLLIPNFYGGASEPFDPRSEEYRTVSQVFGNQAQQITAYWGDQPFTSGPVYVGAVVCFLFVLGLILVPGPIKWWLLGVTALSLMLSWGKNFFLTDLFFDYFPAYNKFRAPTMILVLAEFAMPLLGFLGLREFMNADLATRGPALRKALYLSAGITAGLSLILLVGGSLFLDFLREVEKDPNIPAIAVDSIVSYRENLLQVDALRTSAFILFAAGLLWYYLRDSSKQMVVFGGLALLILVDMVPVNRRYLNMDNTVTKARQDAMFQPTASDQYILQDKDPNFRVLNLTVNMSSDKITPYHHKSVGGYHAAKLRRYQDLMDSVLVSENNRVRSMLQGEGVTDSIIQATMARNSGLNMLNTRYLIYNPQAPNAIQNLSALGNAWFVSDIRRVNSPQEEILALRNINPAQTAVLDVTYDEGKFGDMLSNFTPADDPSATIELTGYDPKKLTYVSNRQGEGLAVFSEIYYNDDKGWNAYLNGEKVPHARVNYVLRALKVPAGRSEIEFRFEPQAYLLGNTLGMIFSILLLAGLAGAIFWETRKARTMQGG